MADVAWLALCPRGIEQLTFFSVWGRQGLALLVGWAWATHMCRWLCVRG